MTVAAWDGTTLAIDRQGTADGWSYPTKKLFLFPKQKIALALSGNLARFNEISDWVLNFKRTGFSKFPEFQHEEDLALAGILVIDGTPYVISIGSGIIPALGDYHAIGSGRDYALSAMELGHDAITAVEIANKLSVTCGHGVDWARCK